MDTLPLELRKLGLNEKEAAVYLAGLELGPTSVQQIAKKTKISRPTAYVIIQNLEKRGLFREAKEAKKKYYAAQSPDSILGLLRIQKRALEEKEREFIRIITVLKSKYLTAEKGISKLYRGKEGLKVFEEELLFTSSPEIFLISSEINAQKIAKRIDLYEKIKQRLGGIAVKEIYPKKVLTKRNQTWLERKSLPKINFEGNLFILDKVIFEMRHQQEEIIVIEDEFTVGLFKSFFLTLWRN